VSPCRAFALPVEDKSLAELLDFERPGDRFSGLFPMRHDSRQKLKVADMRSQVSEPAFVGIVEAQGVSRIFLCSFPALDVKAKIPRRVSGLKIIVASGRLTIKAGGSSHASVRTVHGMFCEYCMSSRKNPALFRKIFRFSRFYAILFTTSLIACESFARDILTGFQGLAIP
jgi:hypothetical protein